MPNGWAVCRARDLRFPVASVVVMVADGLTAAEILTEHPDLETEDIAECLRYAALAVRELGFRRSAQCEISPIVRWTRRKPGVSADLDAGHIGRLRVACQTPQGWWVSSGLADFLEVGVGAVCPCGGLVVGGVVA